MVRVWQIELPPELGGLVYLETLDIENCVLKKSIPSDILVHLPRLSCLVLPNWAELPEGIDNMKSLRTLQVFGLQKNSLECILDLGELTNLRELSLEGSSDLGTTKVDALACSIGKLRNLKCLCFSGKNYEFGNNQPMASLSNPFQHMERLCLQDWRFCRVPNWIAGFHCLRFLELSVEEMSTGVVLLLLGALPSLVHLRFDVIRIPDERATLGVGLFPVLEFFGVSSLENIAAYLGFEAGAMPNLQTLRLRVYNWHGTVLVGMEHLLYLQEIRLDGASDDVVSAFQEPLLGNRLVTTDELSAVQCKRV
ncbi:disease resistance protein RGA5-like [Aegilops tauschii subsp. strangulata]|uniref:disease resistance protein RGA5-like n=1 Tax=Aegilops tauschii subsp. strangulata TaxID=200361 RepID=UPI003CC89868